MPATHHAAAMVSDFRAYLDTHVPGLKERKEYDLTCDYRLQRFLIARDEDFDKAAKMVADHLEWRKENDMERIRTLVEGKIFSPSQLPHSDMMKKLCVVFVAHCAHAHIERARVHKRELTSLGTQPAIWASCKPWSTPDNATTESLCTLKSWVLGRRRCRPLKRLRLPRTLNVQTWSTKCLSIFTPSLSCAAYF